MSRKKSSVIKSLVVLVAVALIATSMISGGATASEAFKPSTVAAPAAAPAPAVAPAQSLDSQANHTVSVKRLKEVTPEGNALLILNFNNEDKLGKLLRINLDNRTVVFRDDGTGGDEVAGDRRMSARVNFNFAALTANQNRIRTLNTRANAALTMPVLDGRVTVGERQMSLPLSESELQPDQEMALEPVATAVAIDPERSLLIRDPRVVEDPRRTYNPCTGVGTPMGKWTFGYLMQEMANQPMTGIDPATFTRLWLKNWENNLVINGWGIAARQAVKDAIITPWEQVSGGPGAPLDLSKAPFKLIAIVNRIDLRGNSGYTTNNAGEARFVFGAIDRRLNPNGCCTVSEMTVIFEYGIDVRDCNGLKSWANQWVNLSNLVLGSATYNAALEAITEQFAKAGVAPHKVNGSALNQVRTNEFLQPVTAPWEMREFRLTMTREDPFPPTGQLIQTTVKQTPDEVLNNTPVLGNFINANCVPIQTGTHIVPLDFPGPGNSFLGGNSFVPPFFWNAPGLACDPPGPPGNTRFLFSFNTCSGCHGAETATAFYHIRPTPFGTPAGLSLFLSGTITVNDPTNGFARTFTEMQNRANNLDMLANIDCNVFIMDLHNKIEISGEEGRTNTGRTSFVH